MEKAQCGPCCKQSALPDHFFSFIAIVPDREPSSCGGTTAPYYPQQGRDVSSRCKLLVRVEETQQLSG